MIQKMFVQKSKNNAVFLIKQLFFFNKTIIYFYGKSIQMEIINTIILETRAYSWGTRQIISYNRKFIRDFPMHSSAIYHLVSQQVYISKVGVAIWTKGHHLLFNLRMTTTHPHPQPPILALGKGKKLPLHDTSSVKLFISEKYISNIT